MNEEKDEKHGGQKNWLKEHDSIQVDLLKMKDDLIREDETIPEFEKINDVPEAEIHEEILKPEPKQAPPERKISPGMTIKQMLGGYEESKKPAPKEKPPSDPPARLEEGTIPSSPELTSKIANVLQLEHKLKRRKFELEKRSAMKDIPPPPEDPKGSSKKTVIDWEDEKEKEDTQTKHHKLPEEPTPPPEMKKSDPERQIQVQSETPYPPANGISKTEGSLEEDEDPIKGTETEKEEETKKKKKGLFSFFSRNK